MDAVVTLSDGTTMLVDVKMTVTDSGAQARMYEELAGGEPVILEWNEPYETSFEGPINYPTYETLIRTVMGEFDV